jgi:hypothetical protein
VGGGQAVVDEKPQSERRGGGRAGYSAARSACASVCGPSVRHKQGQRPAGINARPTKCKGKDKARLRFFAATKSVAR